jgi:hypothetical protein
MRRVISLSGFLLKGVTLGPAANGLLATLKRLTTGRRTSPLRLPDAR